MQKLNAAFQNLTDTYFCVQVAVSSHPGRTKHYQTHFVPTTSLVLCDCPGLVFPRFGVGLPLQTIAGSYPIARCRDPYSVIRCVHFPASVSFTSLYPWFWTFLSTPMKISSCLFCLCIGRFLAERLDPPLNVVLKLSCKHCTDYQSDEELEGEQADTRISSISIY